MSEFYDPSQMNDEESIRVIHRYLDTGGNFLDTADVYGLGRNEVLVGKALADRRDKAVLATKFANVRGPKGEFLGVRGDAKYVRECCEASLSRLKVGRHRPLLPAPRRPQGADRGDGRRDGGAREGRQGAPPRPFRGGARHDPPRRGRPSHHGLQTEYSLWSRDPEDEILATVRELGIGFVAYSPLGRGFLTGQFKKFEDLPADDYRRNSPRFQGENFQKNLDLVSRIESLAASKGCTASQLALAWVVAQGRDIVPIPGDEEAALPRREPGVPPRDADGRGPAQDRRGHARRVRLGPALRGPGHGRPQPLGYSFVARAAAWSIDSS